MGGGGGAFLGCILTIVGWRMEALKLRLLVFHAPLSLKPYMLSEPCKDRDLWFVRQAIPESLAGHPVWHWRQGAAGPVCGVAAFGYTVRAEGVRFTRSAVERLAKKKIKRQPHICKAVLCRLILR